MTTPWYVVQAEPNRENTARRQLERMGCESYVPVYHRAHCNHVTGSRRWRVYMRPLFTGYVFLRAESVEDLWLGVRIAVGVRRQPCPFLAADGHPAAISEGKIGEIRLLEREINLMRSETLTFRVGDRVLVQEGVFSGFRAAVHTLTDSARITLLLDFLGRSTRVSVPVGTVAAAA